MPTLADLHAAFVLDEEIGRLLWRTDRLSGKGAVRVAAGSEAGSLYGNGYRYVLLDGKKMLVHRVIFAMVNGHWPEAEVDHANGDTTDNRPGNLRAATSSQNKFNQRPSTRRKSGERGTTWHPDRQKWGARMRIRGKNIHLGYFPDVEMAGLAYATAADRFHGQFARVA